MAKSEIAAPSKDPDHDEWQDREDVDRLLRADEVHRDKGRHKRAVARLSGTLKRLQKKSGRSSRR